MDLLSICHYTVPRIASYCSFTQSQEEICFHNSYGMFGFRKLPVGVVQAPVQFPTIKK